ncbi:MAG TPA: tetratricopeptide repeat protein [Spirochaetota bacterium]|nr:tetratricopeptide repeat protein [Spirochaetota bacterium]
MKKSNGRSKWGLMFACFVFVLVNSPGPQAWAIEAQQGDELRASAGPLVQFGTMLDAERWMARGEWKKAEQVFQSILAVQAEHPRAWLLLGYCRMQMGDYQKALESYQRSESLVSTPDALAGTHWASIMLGDWDASLAIGKKILERWPGDLMARLRMAWANRSLGRLAEAEAGYRSVLADFPTHDDASFGLSLVLIDLGKDDEAARFRRTLLARNPEHEGARLASGLPANPPTLSLVSWEELTSWSGSSLRTTSASAGFGFRLGLDSLWSLSGFGSMTDTDGNSGGVTVITGFSSRHDAVSGLWFSWGGNFITGDDRWSDGALQMQLALGDRLEQGDAAGFNLSLAGMHFPYHDAIQIDLGLDFQFASRLRANLLGHGMGVMFSNTGGGRLRLYGALDAGLTLDLAPAMLSTGVRLGSLYTPILSGQPVYNTEVLGFGFFVSVGVDLVDWLGIKIAYACDEWEGTGVDRPVSETLALILEVRIP